MTATFRVSVVTPEREVLGADATFAAIPAYDGEIGFLPRRSALLTQLGSGLLRIEEPDGGKRQLFISGGFAQMVDDKLTLLTEEALEPDAIASAAITEQLAAATAISARSEQEFTRKSRAVERARALRRVRR